MHFQEYILTARVSIHIYLYVSL